MGKAQKKIKKFGILRIFAKIARKSTKLAQKRINYPALKVQGFVCRMRMGRE